MAANYEVRLIVEIENEEKPLDSFPWLSTRVYSASSIMCC